MAYKNQVVIFKGNLTKQQKAGFRITKLGPKPDQTLKVLLLLP